jgi:excisionase family DNA binding protein
MNNLYTTSQAAARLGVSAVRIRRLIKDGRITARKQGRDLFIDPEDLRRFENQGRKPVGRPREGRNNTAIIRDPGTVSDGFPDEAIQVGSGKIIHGDALKIMPNLPEAHFQTIVADPPYFQVLLEQNWDNMWQSPEDYLEWTKQWVEQCQRLLRPDGLLYIFGQLGKREHVWLHTCSMLAREMQFHDLIIWDRAVGYNERYDSFTPQYEMILVLRQTSCTKPYFNKDAVRLRYDEATIQSYLRDKRYKDKEAREKHLRKGKYATNILRVPSLKGSSKEKIGHPAQKPLSLIKQLIAASSRPGDWVLDPFLGSGTTAAAAEQLGRLWMGIDTDEAYLEIVRQRIESPRSESDLYQAELDLS